MNSQERDIEKGLSETPRDNASVDARSILATPPPGAMYSETAARPVAERQTSIQVIPRPNLASIPSTMSFGKPDALHRFRSHLGIVDSDDLTKSGDRVAENFGIYKRVVNNERRAHQQYQIFACLINGALGLQIIFAAALTALGAGNGPRSAVTAFGAMNTILAGFLTFLKGSGLPNRLKYYENEWAKVREYIEQRERDFAHVTITDHEFNLLEEIAVIERMYENVRKDIEASAPDSYISMNKSAQNNNNNEHPPSLSRALSQYSQRAQDRVTQIQDGVRDRYSHIQSGIDSRLRDTQSFADDRLQETREYAESRIRDTRGYFEDEKSRAQSSVQVAVQEIQSDADARIRNVQEATESRVKEMEQKIKEGESKAKEVEGKVLQAAEKAAGKVLQFIDRRKDGH